MFYMVESGKLIVVTGPDPPMPYIETRGIRYSQLSFLPSSSSSPSVDR